VNSLAQGVRATDLKRTNERVVLDDVRLYGPTTAPEIAKRTSLSKPTVGSALRTLQGAGFVREQGFKAGRSGQAPLLWSIDEHAGFILSIDVGTQWVRLGLRSLNGEPRGTFRARSDSGSADDVLLALTDALTGLLVQESLSRDAIVYAVMGSPGVVDPASGRLQHASNLPGWDDKATLAALNDVFGPNFLIMKDVYLAALGEAEARQTDGARDFVLLSVGRGVGAAVVRDGQPLSGANGLAGEIAFLPLGVDPLNPDAPSLRGSLEEAASADAMLSYGEFDAVAELVRAAREGHPRAAEALARESRLVAYALSPLILIVDPPLIVLTGSVGLHGGPEFAESVHHDLGELLPVRVPPVEVSAAGELATLRGAATKGLELAWDMLMTGL